MVKKFGREFLERLQFVNNNSFITTGVYGIDEIGRPMNPRGRTGVSGKGNLKRWGPNHQGDVIVTRYTSSDNTYLSN